MTTCANTEPTIPWTPPERITCELHTPRLIVRGYTLDDAPALFEAVNDSRDGHLLPWMNHWAATGHRTLEFSAKYICEQALSLQNPETFTNVGTGIFERTTGRFVGGSGVHDLRRETASCETGYWIRRDAIGKGYAREACSATISWALRPQPDGGLGLRRVRLFCSSGNTHSARVIEQLGIRPEVHQRDEYFVPGVGLTDRLGWGVLREEWDCASDRALTPAAR